jgi:hypothetical protein
MPTYKILSLDGGGCWSILQIMALRALYGDDTKGYDVLKQFDLVAANSGGSITLAGLATNKTLAQIQRDFFENDDLRRKLFMPRKWLRKSYSTKTKLAAIQTLLGEVGKISLSDLFNKIRAETQFSPEILICASDSDRNRAEFFRSNHSKAASTASAAIDPTNPSRVAEPSLIEVIHASTTGPAHLYDSPAKIGKNRFWDGAAAGLYNPILAALTEALANDSKRGPDIRVLSIGTGTVQLPIWTRGDSKKLTRGTDALTHDSDELARNAFYDPPDSATFVAHVMLGQPLPQSGTPLPVSGAVIRLNPVMRPHRENGKWVPPKGLDEDTFQKLALEADAVEPDGVKLVKLLGKLWIDGEIVNQPIRSSREYTYEIGHERFSKAIADWKARI